MHGIRFKPELELSGVIFNPDRQSELGRGKDAVVYRGRLGSASVAVKVLNDELVRAASREHGRVDYITRFFQEGNRLKQLHHPNVIQFYGFCRHENIPSIGIVTELCVQTLMSRYMSQPMLTECDKIGLLGNVAFGLRYLHSVNIIHRDLTTRNVLIATDGTAKLADLGLAAALHGGRARGSAMTYSQNSLVYQGPESLEPFVYDCRADVFSFGVLAMASILCREPNAACLLQSPMVREMADGRVERILEVKRRSRATDLSLVGQRHPLYDSIVACLQNDVGLRPTSEHLCRILDKVFSDLSFEVNRISALPLSKQKELQEWQTQFGCNTQVRQSQLGDEDVRKVFAIRYLQKKQRFRVLDKHCAW